MVLLYVTLCAIWYNVYNFENVKNTDGIMLLFKLLGKACNFTTKSNIPPWVFFTV